MMSVAIIVRAAPGSLLIEPSQMFQRIGEFVTHLLDGVCVPSNSSQRNGRVVTCDQSDN